MEQLSSKLTKIANTFNDSYYELRRMRYLYRIKDDSMDVAIIYNIKNLDEKEIRNKKYSIKLKLPSLMDCIETKIDFVFSDQQEVFDSIKDHIAVKGTFFFDDFIQDQIRKILHQLQILKFQQHLKSPVYNRQNLCVTQINYY